MPLTAKSTAFRWKGRSFDSRELRWGDAASCCCADDGAGTVFVEPTNTLDAIVGNANGLSYSLAEAIGATVARLGCYLSNAGRVREEGRRSVGRPAWIERAARVIGS